MHCILTRSIQRKNKFYILSHLGQTTFGYAITITINRGKGEKHFSKSIFSQFYAFFC